MCTPVKLLTVTCLLLLLYTTDAHAQLQWQVKQFTTENGLSSNGIKGLQWDEKTGFLWIATEAGLLRYNGLNFKAFDLNSNPEFGSDRIVTLAKNIYGKILVAGQTGNLSLVKDNTVSYWFNGLGLAKNNYNYLSAVSASDTLFKKCFQKPWPNIFGTHYSTVIPFNDTICLALTREKLYYYSISVQDPQEISAIKGGVKTVFKIGHDVYYTDSLNQVYAFNPLNFTSDKEELLDPDGKKFMLLENESKLFWQQGMDAPVLVQQGNAWLIENKHTNVLQCRHIGSGIPDNALFKFAQYDRKLGYLFLGTASKGIYMVYQNQLQTQQPAEININQPNSFYSQIELPNGNILTNLGVVIGDISPGKHYDINNTFLKNVFEATDSTLIYNSKDSFYLYNKYRGEKKTMFAFNINENHTLAYSGKQLYLVNQTGIGIIRNYKSFKYISYFDTSKNASVLDPAAMVEISENKLAIATCGGLLLFNTKTKQTDTLLKLPSVCIRTLYKEGAYILIGTYGGGYYVLKNGVLKSMPLDINQYLKYTHCFIKDRNGFFWISTNNGLFKVKTADIFEAYEKDIPRIYYHYFGKNDGMQTTEMNGGCNPCALRLKNNNFSFPTMDGLIWINPEKANTLLPEGRIYIDKIQVNGLPDSSATDKQIQLPQNIQKLDISLAVNAWCRKENLYIDYRLNKNAWLPVEITSGEPRISFNNLAYGSHTLTIRKMNGFGTNNYIYTTLYITVATPFYLQWWFRILALLVIAGIGYLIFRFRLKQYALREKKLTAMVEQKTMDLNTKNTQLENSNHIKMRLISIINHDIMTPLKFMHYAGKALVENKGTINPEDQFATISEITQTAKDMELLSSQILNWIIYQNPDQRMQQEEFNLHQLVEMVYRVLQFSARQKNTLLVNNIPENFVLFQYLEPMRVMLYNLVVNSLNFTKQGTIQVGCLVKEGCVVLQVSDTGLGMTKEQRENILSDEKIFASTNVDNKKGTGLGYFIIKDLLRMMDAKLDIESTKNVGTVVTIILPPKKIIPVKDAPDGIG